MILKIFKNTISILLILFLLSCQFLKRITWQNNRVLPSFQNSIGMEFLEVQDGKFQMGCSNSDSSCDEDELPAIKVEITKSFYLGKYEVTKKQFARFISETSYTTDADTLGFVNSWRNCHGIKQEENHPVICVSWNDGKAFTKWLSEKEGKKYRLPTEVEWEYAARAGFFARYSWGINMDESFAWYNKNSKKTTQPVGIKKPNSWGFFDLSGNVWEWCEDEYDPDYFKRKEKEDLPLVKNKNNKVLRGGSWFDSYLMLRVSTRKFAPKDARENNYGFRVVLEK